MATVTAIKNKTQSKIALKKVVEYVSQNQKILLEQDGGNIRLLSGKDCCGDTALQEFLSTKRQYRKEKGRWFYQYVQSFKPGENATPQEIHQMGLELAEAFKGYEVLVATHIDNDHWHNHLIVNSVSYESGLKLQFNEQDLNRLRDRSDEICKSNGLDTLEPYQKPASAGLRAGEYRAALRGDSWKFRLMADIDSAMQTAATTTDFIFSMQQRGYSVKWEQNHKYITYVTQDGKKCRDSKLHDGKYLKANMEEYFEQLGRTQTAQRFAGAIPAACSDEYRSAGMAAPDGAAARRNPANSAQRQSILEHLANAKTHASADKESRGYAEKMGGVPNPRQSQMGDARSSSAHAGVNLNNAPKMKKNHYDHDR